MQQGLACLPAHMQRFMSAGRFAAVWPPLQSSSSLAADCLPTYRSMCARAGSSPKQQWRNSRLAARCFPCRSQCTAGRWTTEACRQCLGGPQPQPLKRPAGCSAARRARPQEETSKRCSPSCPRGRLKGQLLDAHRAADYVPQGREAGPQGGHHSVKFDGIR